jgi:tetratricopeptide (TPR) repeat protein
MGAPMSSERWRRLEALFPDAASLPPSERDAFVSRETAGDADLANELRGMLAAMADGGRRIASAIAGVAETVAIDEGWIGRRCGAYRITRGIGCGGMALVFEAVRDDEEFRKTVALKVAPLWRGHPAMFERFRVERQILAELEHPNIARLLDGGTEDGVPYFVMEYVNGVPVTEFCRARGLDLRARLALVRTICAAVHFAHQHLIVHRDLKPANILVDADGAPHLLDFGIAKLLDPLARTDVTAPHDAAWTPDYASPEQVRGRPVTTRTDVYSLGLILYELLSGERAQIADASSPLALDRSICETSPPLPSERAAARRDGAAAKALRGDLDTIVMTAIRKEPERRYETVAALSDDIGRWLDRAPIRARPSTVGYRAAKFLRRHRMGAAAAALVAVSLVAGLGVAIFEARRADRRFQQVRSLANAFVFDVHDEIEQLPGATAARKSIVQTALVYLESLRQDVAGDPALARELAAAYEKVGTAQGVPTFANLGDSAGALVSLTRAEELLAPVAARGDRQGRRQLVSVHVKQGLVHEAQGKTPAAEEDYAHARALGERLLTEIPDDHDLLAVMTDVYAATSRVVSTRGDWAGSERAARRALELSEHMRRIAPDRPAHLDFIAGAYSLLGIALQNTGRLDEAMESYRASIRAREELVAKVPDNAGYRRTLLISYGHLGDGLAALKGANLGDIAGGVSAFEKAAALADWARQKDPADRRAQFDFAAATQRLGSVEAMEPPRRASALRHLEEADRVTRRLVAEDPQSNRYLGLAVLLDFGIGDLLDTTGRSDEAARRVTTARDESAKLTAGPYRRNWIVRSTARLALLRARAADRQAIELVQYVSHEIADTALLDAYSDASARDDLAHAYAEIARHAAPADRAAALRAATASCEDSLKHWRSIAVRPEADRARHVAALETLLADLRSSEHARPPS